MPPTLSRVTPPPGWATRERVTRAALAFGGSLLVGWAIAATGTLDATAATLVVMGFSPDRGALIAAFVLEAAGAAAGTLLAGTRRLPGLAGAILFAAAFNDTFVNETSAAVAASGAVGSFDPVGWWISLLTLVASVAVLGWATTTLVRLARGAVIDAGRDVRTFVRSHQARALARPAAAIVTAVVLGVAMPTLADMLNFEPDAHMRQGSASTSAVTGAAPLPTVSGELNPGIFDNGGVVSGQTTPSASILSAARPWLASRPTGSGTVTHLVLPTPWGPTGTTENVYVYLPPGYATGTGRYPVMYAVPHSMESWIHGVGLLTMLDALIDSGRIPATIVVFASEGGGPYPDSECANTADGREWFDRWVAATLVPQVDATFRTMSNPAARGVMGFSQGGFCAASLVTRHPDLFGTDISFSGYYQAGIRNAETLNAWRVYSGIPSYEAQFSPQVLVPSIPMALRSRLFFELSANPLESFFGPQYVGFTGLLHAAGIALSLFPTPVGHAWAAVREQLPTVLATWAARMTALAVFAT